jgi:hypothetical protein
LALRPRTGPWSDLFSFSLLAYCLAGPIGAAMLEMAVPPLMNAYAGASSPAAKQILEAVFRPR